VNATHCFLGHAYSQGPALSLCSLSVW